MRPTYSAAGTQSADNRILPGSVVEYEQHSKPYLGIVTGERKNLFVVMNERGQELTLPSDRIFLLPISCPVQKREEVVAFLENFLAEARASEQEVDIGSVWELTRETHKEVSERTIVEILFPNASAPQLLAVRRALFGDTVFFKRRKSGFEPRSPEVVEELKKKAEQDELRRKEREAFAAEILDRLAGHPRPLEKNWSGFGVSELEQLAALGSQSPQAKETSEFIEELLESGKVALTGRPQEKALQLLVKIGHCNEDLDLNLIASGRPVGFSPAIISEVKSVASSYLQGTPAQQELTVVTIDSESTRDIDDGLSLERTAEGYRIGIHISDVSSIVKPGTRLDEQSLRRATSIYTPDYQIPMLPPELSEGLLSLVEGAVRPVMSFYLETDALFEIQRTFVKFEYLRITRRLSYNYVDEVLCDEKTRDPHAEMLISLWDAASTFESRRIMEGALQFNRRDLWPRVDVNGLVTLERNDEETPARKLVSEMMVAANIVAATYARDNQVPVVYRSQDKPDVDILAAGEDIPEGPAREYYRRGLMKRSVTSIDPLPHYGLAAPVYIQVTSPIRRMLDLVNQRQLSDHLRGENTVLPPSRLREVLEQCESRLDEANFLQRQRTRYWLLRYFEQQRITNLTGTIVRVDEQRPLVELDGFMTILPFQKAKKVGDFSDRTSSRLGAKISLKVQKISARDDKFYLVEDE